MNQKFRNNKYKISFDVKPCRWLIWFIFFFFFFNIIFFLSVEKYYFRVSITWYIWTTCYAT